jgi:AraC family transcriptional regulator
MNAVIEYIETIITNEIDYKKVAQIAACPINQFQRFFAYITNITLSEYLRRRRLTLCAFELQESKAKVIEVASKYGYDSPSSFSRAFREFHGITPSQAADKGAVFNIFPKLSFQIPDLSLDIFYERGNKMAVLGKLEVFNLPPVRMIGIEVAHGYDCVNPVPELWDKCFKQGTLKALKSLSPEMEYYIGWMGDYNSETKRFAYIAGYFMPVNTPVPDGFQYRDLPACMVGMGYINGSFDDVFPRLHDLTVDGIHAKGYEPDYTQGWSAEVYATDLPFEATEGTVNYMCPCKVKPFPIP